MADYQRSQIGGELVGYRRRSDGAHLILTDPVVLAWIAAGGVPDPPDLPVVQHAGWREIDRQVRTTTATPTEVYRATLQTMTGYTATLTLTGVDAGSGALRVIRASVVAKRLGGGALLVGPPVVLANHADAATAAWAITATVSGNDFVVTVTGEAGRSIDWHLSGRVQSFTPGGA